MNDFASLIFYFFIFFLSYIFYNLYNKNKNKLYLFLSFIILFLVSILRSGVGTDYYNYKEFFNYGLKIDLGFTVISFLARQFGGFEFLICAYSFLTLLFFFKSIKDLKEEAQSFAFLIFLFLFYTLSFNAIRQMLAASIVLFSYKYMIKKDIFKFSILIIFSSLFHSSSILFWPFYFIINLKSEKIKIFVYCCLLIIVLNYNRIILLLSKISLFSKYIIYSDNLNVTVGFNNYTFYLSLLLLFFILFNKKRIKKVDNDTDKYIYLYSIYVIILLTGFFNPFIKRMGIYFELSNLYLLSYIPLSFNNPKNKLLNYIIIFIFIVTFFIISALLLKQGEIIPYKFITK